MDTEDMNVRKEGSEVGLQPKYLRYNLWGADHSLPITIAERSESAIPLPRPPTAELKPSSQSNARFAPPSFLCELPYQR